VLSRLAQEEIASVLDAFDPRYQRLLRSSGLVFVAEDARNRGSLGGRYGYSPFDRDKNIHALYTLRDHAIIFRVLEERVLAHELIHALDALYERRNPLRFYSDTLPKTHPLRVLFAARQRDGRIVHNGYGGSNFGEFFAESLLPFACSGLEGIATIDDLFRIDHDTGQLFQEFHVEFCRRLDDEKESV